MEFPHIVQEQPYDAFCGHSSVSWNKVSSFGDKFYHCHNCIKTQ